MSPGRRRGATDANPTSLHLPEIIGKLEIKSIKHIKNKYLYSIVIKLPLFHLKSAKSIEIMQKGDKLRNFKSKEPETRESV